MTLLLLPRPAPAATVAALAIPRPSGRPLTPAGTLLNGGDFPASAVLAGGGLYAADDGQSAGAIVALSPAAGGVTATSAPLSEAVPPPTNAKPTANSGRLTVSADGTKLYLPGAALGILHTFTLTAPGAAPLETTPVTVQGAPNIWGAVGASSGTVYVTETFQSNGLGPSGDQGHDVLAVDPASGAVSATIAVGREPFGIVDGETPGGERVVALDRESDQLSVIDPAANTVVRTVAVGRSPADAVFTADGRDLLVTASLDDELDDVDTTSWTVRSRTRLGSSPDLGASPSAVALDPAGTHAYVALGADNAVAVLARSSDGGWTQQGEIPTATFPTGVAYVPASTTGPAQLFITDGKGTGLPVGTPAGTPEASTNIGNATQTGSGLSGSLELVPVPDTTTLAGYTQQVLADDAGTTTAPLCPTPPTLTGITHVVYVIRENKTFDEELGDTAYGDPALVMYPQAITPNTHAIAARSALLGNFYSDEEVSDTGHAAVTGGVANDFLERTTQQSYGLGGTPRQGPELGNDDDTNDSPDNFLFDDALDNGTSFRDYGEFYRKNQNNDSQAVSPAMQSHIQTGYPGFGFDPNTPDTQRIAYWAADFQRDVAQNTFPALEVLYLPYDHTTENTPTPAQPVPVLPQQEVADSDLATGQLIGDLSSSPYWDSTAVFLTEDDPQSGMDHVDDHRTVGLVTGGRAVQQQTTTHYDSSSMLRTIEEILGLPAMTEFDATAAPMDDLFSATPDPVDDQPYTPTTPTILQADPIPAQTAATPASVAASDAALQDMPAADQFAAQWTATHGSQPVPHPAARPAWAATIRASALTAPGACASSSTVTVPGGGAAFPGLTRPGQRPQPSGAPRLATTGGPGRPLEAAAFLTIAALIRRRRRTA